MKKKVFFLYTYIFSFRNNIFKLNFEQIKFTVEIQNESLFEIYFSNFMHLLSKILIHIFKQNTKIIC